MYSLLTFFVVGGLLFQLTAAQQLREHIWSVVAFTRYGDRTPVMFSDPSILTPLGAQQLYNAGSFFRQRYIVPASPANGSAEITRIRDIAAYQLDYPQLNIVSTDEQHTFASAQACMQGIYPPLELGANYTYITGVSPLADGSNAVAPLNGYQYPNVLTASSGELNSIYIAGSDMCPNYEASTSQYFTSSDFDFQQSTTQKFYSQLQPLLTGVFSNASIGYVNAYLIWDYLNYMYVHNTTYHQGLSAAALGRAKILADNLIFALNANLSASGITQGDRIRAIAGRTLANRVLQALYTNINTQGTTNKLTMLFGGFEPMVAFAALAQLEEPMNQAFYSVPGPGSSFVFEMYTLESLQTVTYPKVADLYVRFMYRTGTGPNDTFYEYPLFGRGPSNTRIPLTDFITAMEKIMIFSPQEWCETCASYSLFCPAFTGDVNFPNTGGSLVKNSSKVSPAIAGVIGAAATLVTFGLVVAAVMLLGGVRLYRKKKDGKSDLAGFKGGEKMASDQDLVIPKNGAVATVAAGGPSTSNPRERVGSWELKDQAKAKEIQNSLHASAFQEHRPSFEDDDLNVNNHNRPTQTRDYV